MSASYLHDRSDFEQLLRTIEGETGILVQLIEKDYWIMHVLYGLKQQGFEFELKGGTSLSKAYNIIDRFSEDIDIHIKPDPKLGINENPKNSKPKNVDARKRYYDQLTAEIKIDGIIKCERDHAFDNQISYASGGIRLYYNSLFENLSGVKDGILLEVGFDQVAPNSAKLISSWAFEKASPILENAIIDNRAKDIYCYHPGYAFVEKLQTIATKFRREQETGDEKPNLLRQYYDTFCLLANEEVINFIGSKEYYDHKEKRFPDVDFHIPIRENQAFLLSDPKLRKHFEDRFKRTSSLYYKGQPTFTEIIDKIHGFIDRL
ncbi:MAG: nucleotidyl transferase AbiEii/AbiGii toxin family protein [Cryomorphaceae bacterium]|nr:nucleotidyl transferase AbiEii/AbiGii toxin family protein [Cryomorphaceae bacterium]